MKTVSNPARLFGDLQRKVGRVSELTDAHFVNTYVVLMYDYVAIMNGFLSSLRHLKGP